MQIRENYAGDGSETIGSAPHLTGNHVKSVDVRQVGRLGTRPIAAGAAAVGSNSGSAWGVANGGDSPKFANVDGNVSAEMLGGEDPRQRFLDMRSRRMIRGA
ncbi:hypothetical protein L0U85_17940 [Glycomyces sp. L485]|uniref:hypothetical protein n=1 Tax=Glycomyces sp. L485 TaxID=2909235 RepID=UPI001F4AFCA9|nr:hypothetical protein [Glycomyces sp. L485]MCH7232718.1 hypothetical protein [Glycomyces sp. L485]